MLPGAITGSTVEEVLNLLRYKYVDSVNLDSIETNTVLAALKGLDPHTIYIEPTQVPDANAELEGGFGGIGIEYQMIGDTLNVVYVVEKGPSQRAGLESGDKLIAVSGDTIAGVNVSIADLRKKLRGKTGSKVKVTYLRENLLDSVEITRGIISLPSVDAAFMLTDTIGYIRLNKFSGKTYVEFMEAFTSLKKKGMQKLIFDLRGNGGGVLEEATKIADEFLQDGNTIVSTKGLHIKGNEIKATKPGEFEEQPLVVLIDEQSASASEVLAGALQDNDRGIIIGRRSFGKGLVQEQYDLMNGGAIRLTVARYYTPTGRSIQKPYVKGKASYNHEIFERNDSAYTVDSSSIKKYTTPKGRLVFDGGGITPDLTVQAAPIPASKDVNQLLAGDMLNQFSFDTYTKMRSNFKTYSNAAQYASQFAIDDALWKAFVTKAQADSISLANLPDSTKTYLKRRLKALMARYVWRNDGYYYVLSSSDPFIEKAVDYFNQQKSRP